jgi:hypothetical protein
VPRAIVEHEQIQRLWEGRSKAVEPPLERMAVEVG